MYFADTLSRAHTTKAKPDNLYDPDISIAAISYVEEELEEIALETNKDDTLNKLVRYIRQG